MYRVSIEYIAIFFINGKKDVASLEPAPTWVFSSLFHLEMENLLAANISSVVEFQRWWVLKSKILGQESYEESQFIKNWA